MKNLSLLFIAAIALLLSACGVNYATIANQNHNITQVQFNSNNFKVVDRVVGTADVTYIVAIGGLKKKQLYEKAYSDMIAKANLINSSKAIINVVTEEHAMFITPYFIRRTITVSANVVEFNR